MSSPAPPRLSDAPATTDVLLATFADLYRQEIGAEEDVHRTLPFYGTALGIVVGALAYAAGRLPKWPEGDTGPWPIAYLAAVTLLALAVIEAGLVLVFISKAIVRRDYQRIGPETDYRARLAELQDYYNAQGITGDEQDKELVRDMRELLLNSYIAVTPTNRSLNLKRYGYRALASSHLIRSLICALSATTVIFMADKLDLLPRIVP